MCEKEIPVGLLLPVVASRFVCLVNSSVKMLSSVFLALLPVVVVVAPVVVAVVVALARLFTHRHRHRHRHIDLGLQCASAWNETHCPAPGLPLSWQEEE